MAERKSRENIVVICAHPDDQVFGAGGTIAKYAAEEKNVYTIVFSYGESSHPWLKKRVTAEMRKKECIEANKVLGGKKPVFLGMDETKFKEDSESAKQAIIRFLKSKKPSKVFTHSIDDPHPDHKAVYDIVMETAESSGTKADVYVFDVWNPVNLRKRHAPKMYVNTTATFGKKIEALNCFKSQIISLIALITSVYAGAFLNGLHSGTMLAEVFYKAK